MRLDDDRLTREGLAPARHGAAAAAPGAPGRLLVIACGALAHEITALIRLNGWDHIALACLPAIWHNSPERIAPGVEELVSRHRNNYEKIFCAYADCGTGGRLKATCERLGIEMIEGPHCYSFFEGNAAFAAHGESEISTFYLTDFLARQFEAFVIRPLGLDRHPELRDAYFGHYEKLVYLAQTDSPALSEKARRAAERLGLAYERRFTGYGDLATALAGAAASATA